MPTPMVTPSQLEEAKQRYLLAFYEIAREHSAKHLCSMQAVSPQGDDEILQRARLADHPAADRLSQSLYRDGLLEDHGGFTLEGLEVVETLLHEMNRPWISRTWERLGTFVSGIVLGAVGQAIIQAATQSQPPWWAWWSHDTP